MTPVVQSHHHPPPPSHHHPPPTSHHKHHHGNHINVLPAISTNNRHNQPLSGNNVSHSDTPCILLVVSILALLVFMILSVIEPKKPQFDLEKVGVQYINLTASPVNTPIIASFASLSLGIQMQFVAKNHEKIHRIRYGTSTFDMTYHRIPLGWGTVPEFYQPANGVTEVQMNVTVDRVNMFQADAANLVIDVSVHDRVKLRITGDVNANIVWMPEFPSSSVQVSVDCTLIISPSKQALTSKQCEFVSLQSRQENGRLAETQKVIPTRGYNYGMSSQ